MDAKDTNNITVISGLISEEPVLSHTSYDEKFYQLKVKTKRYSGSFDELIVILSEKLIDVKELIKDTHVQLTGELRTYNIVENKKNKLKLVVFAKDFGITEEIKYNDEVCFEGFICKQPVYRTTPLGREICDAIIAINRGYHKSSYVPIISWGRNAKYISELAVGDKIKCYGRLQSRPYTKKISETETVTKIAYEVSLSNAKKIDE